MPENGAVPARDKDSNKECQEEGKYREVPGRGAVIMERDCARERDSTRKYQGDGQYQ